MSTALWSFREDGTGYIRMEHQGKKEIIEFTWVLNDLVLTVTDKQGKDDKITFGFFEDSEMKKFHCSAQKFLHQTNCK